MADKKPANKEEKAAKIRRKPERESPLIPTFTATRISISGKIQPDTSSPITTKKIGKIDTELAQSVLDRRMSSDLSAIPVRSSITSPRPVVQPKLMIHKSDTNAPQPAQPDVLQRDGAEGGEGSQQASTPVPEFHLPEPALGQGQGFQQPGSFFNMPSLQLDPAIAAQMRAIQFMRGLITPENIMQAINQIGSLPPSTPATSGLGASPSQQTTPPSGPLVPPGAGPASPRAASMGDLLKAIMDISAVKAGIARLRTEAESRVRSDWARLSGGDRALVISEGVLIAGGALAGVLSNAEGRRFALDQLQGRSIPIPGLPMTVQFNLTGPDQRVMIGLDVGALLPKEMGFR